MSTTPNLRTRLALALVALLPFAASGSFAQEAAEPAEEERPAERPPPCSSPEHRQFDFWLGDWEVRSPEGEIQGTNRIERILGDCVLMENWSGAGGSSGKSFNMYSAPHGEWHQTWVSDNGTLLQLAGGLADDGRMVLTGEAPGREGGVVRHEISWQPLADGSVRQHWRASRDGGESWNDLFVGIYTKTS